MMKIESIDISQLISDPANLRRHDQRNIDIIKTSIAEYGQYRPFVVQRSTMTVKIGNGMLEAMRQLETTGPVNVVLLDLDDAAAMAMAVADNRASDLSEFDEFSLAQHLELLDNAMRRLAGYSSEEIDRLLDIPVPDLRQPEVIASDRRQPDTMFRFGDIALRVSRSEYDRWLADLQINAGLSASDQLATIKERLFL